MTHPALPSDDASNVSASSPTSTHGPTRSRLWLRVLPAALVAGLASWFVGETPLVRRPPREDTMTVMGRTFSASTPRSRQAAADADAARFFGLLSASFGLALGLVGGLSRRSPRATSAAALVGLLAGASCGLVAARAGVPLYQRLHNSVSNDLIASLAMHATVFAAVGAAGGLALGIGLGGRSRLVPSTLGGVLGALVGTTVFEFLGALLFALSETGHPLAATAPARLLAPLIVTAFASLGASAAVVDR